MAKKYPMTSQSELRSWTITGSTKVLESKRPKEDLASINKKVQNFVNFRPKKSWTLVIDWPTLESVLLVDFTTKIVDIMTLIQQKDSEPFLRSGA